MAGRRRETGRPIRKVMALGAEFTLDFNRLALDAAMSTPKTAELLSKKASRMAAHIRADAPRNRKGSWNSYVRNINVIAWDENVPHAGVEADRHPFVIEFGWRHYITKIRYPGRYPMTRALMKERDS